MTSVCGSTAGAFRARIPRLLMGLGGLALMGLGLSELLALDLVDLLWVGFWLAAGVFLHDAVLGPTTAVLSKLAAARASAKVRRIPLVALVSLGSLTLIALPLLARQGAVAGNPTLLGRNYLVGWAAACLLVLIGAVLAEVLRRARAKRVSGKSTAPG